MLVHTLLLWLLSLALNTNLSVKQVARFIVSWWSIPKHRKPVEEIIKKIEALRVLLTLSHLEGGVHGKI